MICIGETLPGGNHRCQSYAVTKTDFPSKILSFVPFFLSCFLYLTSSDLSYRGCLFIHRILSIPATPSREIWKPQTLKRPPHLAGLLLLGSPVANHSPGQHSPKRILALQRSAFWTIPESTCLKCSQKPYPILAVYSPQTRAHTKK